MRKRSVIKKSKKRSINKKSKKRSRGKKRSRSFKKDGAREFKVTRGNMKDSLLKSLNDINKLSKLKYNYDIDFKDSDEYRNLVKQEDLPNIKEKLAAYIKFIRNSMIYPKEETDAFKNRYLQKLEEIKERFDDMLPIRFAPPPRTISPSVLMPPPPPRPPRRRSPPRSPPRSPRRSPPPPPSSPESFEQNTLIPPTSMFREESYNPVLRQRISSNVERAPHISDPNRERVYLLNDKNIPMKVFDIVTQY